MLKQEDIIHEIGRYECVEQLRVVESVLENMMKVDPEIEKAWHDESVRRWERYKRGESKTVSYDNVMSKYRKQG
ncbi:MAG: addiction module protein [Spartobacteria bacterium]|nr:addiction module protein [Spartobacteria bacterium]